MIFFYVQAQGKQRFALTPLQSEATNPSALVSGGSTTKEKQMAQSKLKFPTKQKDGLKHRDIHRREQKSSSPALPEIPVTFNKDGRLEVVSDFDTITQVEFGVQTDIMEYEDKVRVRELFLKSIFIILLLIGYSNRDTNGRIY